MFSKILSVPLDKIVFPDRVLANYGPETAEARDLLRRSVGSATNRMWPDRKSSQPAQLDPSVSSGEAYSPLNVALFTERAAAAKWLGVPLEALMVQR